MAKINNRRAVSAQHTNHLAGPGGPGTAGVPGSSGLTAGGNLAVGGPQLHHHHAHPETAGQGGEDVSGMFHQM